MTTQRGRGEQVGRGQIWVSAAEATDRVLECFQLRKEIWHTTKFFLLQKQSNQQTSTQEHDSLLATLLWPLQIQSGVAHSGGRGRWGSRGTWVCGGC